MGEEQSLGLSVFLGRDDKRSDPKRSQHRREMGTETPNERWNLEELPPQEQVDSKDSPLGLGKLQDIWFFSSFE